MTINSMTGFGKGEAEGEHYTVSVEIKTVNNRFKEYRFKMPSLLNFIELDMRKHLDSKFKRGTFDIFVSYKKRETEKAHFDLDEAKIKEYLSVFSKSSGLSMNDIKVNPTDFLRKEFIVDDTEMKEKEMPELVLGALKGASDKLLESRGDEGQKLVGILNKHKAEYESHYNKIPALRDAYEKSVKERITKKFEENKEVIQVENQRFLQEVIYYLEKLDVDEEINRISTHLSKLDKILSSSGEVGRQIDFLVQELNRETNTIGSKSGNTDVSENVVQMKVHLEKIREQALNLE
jgi:uncharacterized protein (TIGR00255 family)